MRRKMNFKGKRNLMFITLILASTTLPIFGTEPDEGSGDPPDESAASCSGSGDSNQEETITTSNAILPTKQLTNRTKNVSPSTTARVKLSAQVLIPTSTKSKVSPIKLTMNIDNTQLKQGRTVSFGAPSTTIMPKLSKAVVNSHTEVSAETLYSTHVPETTKTKERPTEVTLAQEKTQKSTSNIDGSASQDESTLKPTKVSLTDTELQKSTSHINGTTTTPKRVLTTKEKTNIRTEDYSTTGPKPIQITKHLEIPLKITDIASKGGSSKTNKQKNRSKPAKVDAKNHLEKGSKSQKEADEKKESDGNGNEVEWFRRNSFKERNKGSGNFAVLFMVAIVMVVGLYALYHNRQRIVAIVMEGRSPDHRRPNTNKYTKLEDAMPSVRKIMT